MKSIYTYKFHKTKYGDELLVDIVSLDSIRKYIDRHPVHTLTYFDITFITKGSAGFSLEDIRYCLDEGDVICSKPGEIRSWDTAQIPEGYALIFEEEFLLSFFNDPFFLQNLSYFRPERNSACLSIRSIYKRIDFLIRNIKDEINNPHSKDPHILRALLYEILMLLNREYHGREATLPAPPSNRYIPAFVRLVDTYYKTRHDTKYYADRLYITPNYLNEIVRKCLGTTAKGYIRDQIIREAKRLLSYTDRSVCEIADDLHFESSSYFIRLFRQETRITPLQYRKQANR